MGNAIKKDRWTINQDSYHLTLSRGKNLDEITGSSRLCVISLNYIGSIDLCVLCVFVVRSTPSLGEMYLRIHFTHQT
ncbi:Similarity [Microcystis aeruginosa PCC 9809]|uniref:Similarity n=1 Tax=Microcystis aeruginosa PCC 9809 TaxID=1160285 RepID=I4HMQ9_MICAE|nr:Similarity [Microcystis aeruginosa PCC 9809]